MSVFNTLIQRLGPDWVRARVLAEYLFVFQGSITVGIALWGASAERAGLEKALIASAIGIAACLLLRCPFGCLNLAQLLIHGITGQNP
jgi:Na+/serine symporter